MPKSCIVGPPLQTERLSNGRRELLRDLDVEVDGYKITVCEEFDTDFSSIPTILHGVVRWSRVDVAGVVHDWLYRKGSLSRREADKVWRLVALRGKHSANQLQAWLCWCALRWCGRVAWGHHLVERTRATEDAVPAEGEGESPDEPGQSTGSGS